MLQELIQKLQDAHGLSAEQSHSIVNTITGFIKEKFPMLSGAVDNMFAPHADAPAAPATNATAAAQDSSMLDKISDVIPGQAGEKVEEFAKNTAHKAEEVFDNVKDKLSGLFGGDKN
ncbi:MAG: hypothetical protein JST86_07870 [Bacteroidetes bacterium]|nr:hypothetical protein [Bacteroidota bacterium]